MDNCQVTGRYRGAAHRDCNRNYKILIEFHKLKNYDTHLMKRELGKFDFKINVIPNRLALVWIIS